MFRAIVIIVSVVVVCAGMAPAQLKVSTDLESGSARVLELNQETQTMRIEPAGKPERGMPNWWYLRVDGIDPARPLTLHVNAHTNAVPVGAPNAKKLNSNWTLPDCAAISTDGRTWRQTSRVQRTGDSGAYLIEQTSPTLWLAWGPPFTPADVKDFVQKIAGEHRFAELYILATSREGRPVPGLRIREGKPSVARPAVYITARQHAWESGGSWVAVGLIEWLTGDSDKARKLRQEAEFFIVPLMDADHVATGDGGKHALPQDHNRDWSAAPHWPEVAAAQKQILQLVADNRLALYLDLHNPSAGSRQMAYYANDESVIGPRAARLQARFLDLLRVHLGEFKLHKEPPKEGAEKWQPVIADGWVAKHGNAQTVSLTVETPWNTPQSTPDGYRETGRKLGEAMHGFFVEK